MKKPLMIMLVGVPATGKSTFRKKLENRYPDVFQIASADDLIEQYAKNNNITYTEAYRILGLSVANETKDNVSLYSLLEMPFIYDQTNTNNRDKKLSLLRDETGSLTHQCIAIFFDIPNKQEHQKRLLSRPGKTIPAEAIDDFIKGLTYPTKSEGFDKVFNARDSGKIFSYIDNYLRSSSG